MSIAITNTQAHSIKWIVAAAVVAAGALVVFSLLGGHVQQAGAVTPAQYGLVEGNVIRATAGNDPDIYIVNENGYKRLFTNPAIFNVYTHIGWNKVVNVPNTTRDAFGTSGLFRNCQTNDPKVYALEVASEDVGILHWLNITAEAAVAADPQFAWKVFCINTAEMGLYSMGADYTAYSQVPNYNRFSPTPSVVPGNVSVSLSSANPASATVTGGASGVEMLRVRLSGTGTVSTMVIKRVGAGATADFSNVYVYDGATRLTSGKSLSASTGEATFISLNTVVNGSKELSIVADISGSQTAGNVSGFQLLSVGLTSGTVTGTPVSGNFFTMAGSDSGRLDVAKVGSIANPTVGQAGAQLTEFKLTANTEAAWVKRVTMYQGGTVKPSDIKNVKIKTGTTEWSGSVTIDGHLVFDMGNGHFIAKGGDAVFKVYGDLAGRKDEDVNLIFEYAADLYAVGDQFGFGMNTASGTANQGIDALDATSEAHDVTLQGGALTIAFNGPSAGDIGTTTTDTVLLRYAMTSISNIEVRKTELTLCQDLDADGVYNDDADNEANWDDVTDVKVTNEATGVTIMGPKDGTEFDFADDSGSCASSGASGAQEEFTDVFELMAGQTYNFKITADINTANGAAAADELAAGEAIKIVLDNYTDGTDMPAVTTMKYSGTNTAVADADVVPQADIAGPSLTVRAAALTLGLSSVVNDQSFVRGTQGITAAGITFKATQASALTVTDVVLSGYFSEAGTTFSLGSDGTTSVADLVSGVSLYEVESGAVLDASPNSNQLSNTTGTATFNDLNWVIPAGGTKTLGVKVNLGSNALADTDYFAFDINATTDVTALDNGSRTVNAGNADINGGTTSTIVVTVLDSGSLTVAISTADSSLRDHAVYWGQMGDVAGVWRFRATNEAQLLETLQFGEADAGGTQETDLATNAKAVYLEYKNKAGALLTKSGTFSDAGTVSFGFTGDDRPYVPKDANLDVKLKIDYKSKADGGATSNKTWDLDFIGDSGAGTNTFKAIGEGSGIVLQGNSTNIENQDQAGAGINIRNYRVFPEFALVAPTATKLSAADPVLTFTITAKGTTDSILLFDNAAAGSGSIDFAVLASGVGYSADPNFTVRDGAGVIIDTGSITDAVISLSGKRASLSFNFGSADVEINGGSSKTFKIYLDSVADFNTPTAVGVGADYFQLVLRDDENGLIDWVDNSSGEGTTNATDVASTAGYLRDLPMSGYQFNAQ